MELTMDDPRITLDGVAELVPDGGWLLPRRLPHVVDRLSVHPELAAVADMPSGGRLVFRTDATGLALEADVGAPAGIAGEPAPFDVMVDGALIERSAILGRGTLYAELGPGEKAVTVWLPHWGAVRMGTLRLDGARYVAPQPASDRPRWVTYGSSITHCQQALGPSETWPALVAARNGWRLAALGFAGQCHLDGAVARLIRDAPADLISLCLGINVWGASTFPRRTLGAALEEFLATVRDGHPGTPLVVISPIVSPDREQRPNEDGLTLAEIRRIVHEVVTLRRVRGDTALTLIDGEELFGHDDAHLLQDGLHPGPAGYAVLADRLGPLLARGLDGGQLDARQLDGGQLGTAGRQS